MLAAWAAAPARFREDANTEEDFALGGYRDRLIVELAQNAADAATRAGVPGVLSISWDGAVLSAANTGAPLDQDGVIALSSLRASAKSGSAIGRFGVGFSAVLAVCEEPQVISRTGGIAFSAVRTRSEVEQIPSLAADVDRRSGQVPVLRLPWPADGEPPAGFDTEIRLAVRPAIRDAIPELLAGVSAELLLGLAGLAEIRVGDRVLSRSDTDSGVVLRDGSESRTWIVSRVDGRIPPELLADRPTEERERDRWEVIWAVPLRSDGTATAPDGPAVLHAPTPSAQPVSVPARLIATVPLDPDRRHVAEGALADHLIARAGAQYPDLVQRLPSGPERLRLVPEARLTADAFDAAISAACLQGLRSAPILSTVESSRLVVLERDVAEAATVLADVIDGLLPAEWSGTGSEAALRSLGVQRLSAARVVDTVSTVDRPAEWWGRLYAAIQHAADRDALAGLPVPLADGRVVTGARGSFLVEGRVPATTLNALGLRVIDPAAAHPLLERLGAQPATPLSLLEEDGVRSAVAESFDEEDPAPIAEAVLGLLAAAQIEPGQEPWLSDLALPGADGEWYPAGEMVLPGSPLDRIAVPDAPYGRPDPQWIERWGERTLCAAGVLAMPPIIRAAEVVLGDADLQLPDEAAWYEAIETMLPPTDLPVTLTDVAAVADLDLIGSWPPALELLAAEPLRSAVATRVQAVLPDGSQRAVPSYTAWWLATHPVLDGHRPDSLILPSARLLAGLYDVADIDPELGRLIGVRSDLTGILADPDAATDLLHRLAEPGRSAAEELLAGIYGRLADALAGFEVDPPDGVRVAADRVVDRDAVAVLDLPYAAPLLERVPVGGGADPEAVADLLDAPLASALVPRGVDSEPASVLRWDAVPGAWLAAWRCGAAVPAAEVALHEGLRVGGRAVQWWTDGDRDHVESAAGAAALGRALAWRLERWDRRAAAAEALDGADTGTLLLEDSLEP